MDQRLTINAALVGYPHLAKLVRHVADWEQILIEAWNLGAKTSEIHPLIDLILAENAQQRRTDLETGLAELRLTDRMAADFARRIVVKTIPGHRDSAAALTELYVGGRLAMVGATVSFIDRQTKTKTPDLTAVRHGVTVTLEVAAGNVSDQDRDQDVEDATAFHAWRSGAVRPVLQRGEVSERYGGWLRFLAKSAAPLGAGDRGEMVGRIASKKTDDQLKGWANPVLVRSFWHMFGVSRNWCNANCGSNEAPCTGLLFAATYGHEGDPIYEGETFDGEPISYCTQAGDGILVRSSIVRGVLWLFEEDPPVMFESDRFALDAEARELLLDAFGLRGDALSLVRSSHAPSHDEIAIAAYYCWEKRGGDAASERAVDDWLSAERKLLLISPASASQRV
jgi:hypothetical protein